jgi:predicted DNA-binding transcriptional regulator/DNA-binding Xre family transcriptional regulator
MSRSLKIRREYIDEIKLALKQNGYVTQKALAKELNFALATVSNFVTGKPVDFATFIQICDKLQVNWQNIADLEERIVATKDKIKLDTTETQTKQDWGEAADVSFFCGRKEELNELEKIILNDKKCQFLMLLGMGGIGKTSLAFKLANKIQNRFDFLVWRSLRNAPTIDDTLDNLLQFFNVKEDSSSAENLDKKILGTIETLRNFRCLLVFDNVESILEKGTLSGSYRQGYEGYGQLFRCLATIGHRSCIILTSREIPVGLSALVGENLTVRTFSLKGLPLDEIRHIFELKGNFSGENANWQILWQKYSGNPLALKIVAAGIQELFDANVDKYIQFLEQENFFFNELDRLFKQQLERLSTAEKEIIYWLALVRKPIELQTLQKNVLLPEVRRKLPEIFRSLIKRSLIEKTGEGFTLQTVVMEYITDRLVERICQELIAEKFDILNFLPLTNTKNLLSAKNTPDRSILDRLSQRIFATFGSKQKSIERLQNLLDTVSIDLNVGYLQDNLSALVDRLQTEKTIASEDF